ncbi:MAG: hypothetical protein NVS2B3_09290 [Vulcanimicrobiaceae bacterium]
MSDQTTGKPGDRDDAGAQAEKADETLREAGIDPATVGDITDPEQWRKMPKEGGGA